MKTNRFINIFTDNQVTITNIDWEQELVEYTRDTPTPPELTKRGEITDMGKTDFVKAIHIFERCYVPMIETINEQV